MKRFNKTKMSGTGSCGPPVKKIKKSEQTTIDFAFGKSKRKKDEGKLFTISICTVNSPGLLKLFSPGSTFTQFPDLRGPRTLSIVIFYFHFVSTYCLAVV